ncbi:MAG: FAD:protein FMN transferase [Kofleriaceae bacterium]|nr:FAD:protein FMN transferase [Kofleriaceae bacterium]MCB9573883.1 FAD:protein FMN transferase [Kofleriaceae bacterium]
MAARTAPVAPRHGVLVRDERAAMGSRVAISVWTDAARRPAARAAVAAAFDDLAAWEATVSEWHAGSDIDRVNVAAGDDVVVVGDDARALIGRARAWAERTSGIFDPTGGPLFELWARARATGVLPSAAQVTAARARVDWRAVELDGPGVRLARPGMRLGLGGIGKGVAAERTSAWLTAAGFPDHLVDCGGDLAIAGRRGDAPWQIALRGADHAIIAVAALDGGTIATSGDDVQAVDVGGVRYGHILDLRTGWPARGVRDVTVFAPHDADPLATALFVLGPTRGGALLEPIPGAWAVWTRDDGVVVASRRARLREGRVEVSP